jgi:C1A family cysteine protease
MGAMLAVLLLAAGCGDTGGEEQNNPANNGDDGINYAPPLTDVDTLKGDAPKNDRLPSEKKSDVTFPTEFSELVELQSSVKSQGSRGVCSIFSTVGLMEHLYIKEGTLQNPDFSEQYLQWSVKTQVGSFPNTSGSTGRSNLRAISDYGIPEESVWPYDPFPWDESDDEACAGDDKPTRCYTGGEPPAEAENAELYTLPRGRYISTRTEDIKAHMYEDEQAVIVGLDFFYQSWNHGGSSIPVDKSMFRQGFVPYPNETDKEKSLENRAGHSILLVGWDDEAEIQLIDAEGNPRVDENGDPVTEKGFFIFKNSWGTGGFGSENDFPDGYGYISYRYVEEYGSGRVSDVPELEVELPDEVCDDGIDNDENGQTDCDDAACTDAAACETTEPGALTYSQEPGVEIPDNDETGVSSTVDVTETGTIAGVTASVDISHSYSGDLSALLIHPSGEFAILFEADASGDDDIVETFQVGDFDGMSTQGTWELNVWDEANLDSGTLNSWTLKIETE